MFLVFRILLFMNQVRRSVGDIHESNEWTTMF